MDVPIGKGHTLHFLLQSEGVRNSTPVGAIEIDLDSLTMHPSLYDKKLHPDKRRSMTIDKLI